MNKHILITGSTDGIGKLTAIQLAKQGHYVYIHGRNAQKVATVLTEIKGLSNNSNIQGFVADFSDLKAVQNLAKEIQDASIPLDILINNAGVFNSEVTQVYNGLDIRFVVNYFAPYVLTQALLPTLKQSKKARIINLSSAAQAPVNYNLLEGQTTARSHQDAYAQSKLALTMWSFALAKEVKDINVIPVNPGSLLNTNMVKEAFGRYWSSADKGANILIDLAVNERYETVTGEYFDNDRGNFAKAHTDAYDEIKIQSLMDLSQKVLNQIL